MTSVSSINRLFSLSPPGATTTLVFAVIAVIGVAFWHSWSSLFDVWGNRPGYSHGYLVPLISVWLLYARRDVLDSVEPRPVPLILLPIAVLGLLWVVVALASIQIGHQMLVPVIAWLAVFAVAGKSAAGICLLPFGYLYLAMPIWDIFNPALQALTVASTRFLLGLAGISSYIEGNIVTLPNGVFEIAGGCSGLHFFIVSLAISAYFGISYRLDLPRLVLVVLSGVVSGIIANWIRVFVVIVAGYVTDMQHFLVTVDHYYFGWVVFVISLAAVYQFWKRFDEFESTPADVDSKSAAGLTLQYRFGWVGIIAVVLVMAAPVAFGLRAGDIRGAGLDLDLPDARGSWTKEGLPSLAWSPEFHGAQAEASATYRHLDRTIDVYANVYTSQGQGRELVGFDNKIQGANAWRIAETSKREVGADDVRNVPVIESMLVGQINERRLVTYWYDVEGRQITSGVIAKLQYGASRLTGLAPSGVIAVSAACDGDCEGARRDIDSWILGNAVADASSLRLSDLLCASRDAAKSVSIHGLSASPCKIG